MKIRDRLRQQAVTIQTYDENAQAFAARFWSASVDRALDDFSMLAPTEGLVLDLGCGAGRDVAELSLRGYNAIGLDLSAGLLREAAVREVGTLVQGDMFCLPFPECSFEGIWMCASFLHIPKRRALPVLLEVHRVLDWDRPVYIAVKQGSGESWQKNIGKRFFSYYTEEELTRLLTLNGFWLEDLWVNEGGGATWLNAFAVKG